MKIFLLGLAVLFAQSFVLGEEPSSAFAEVSLASSQKSEIQGVVQSYVQAFVQADYGLLQRACTKEFIVAQGGEQRLRGLLKSLQSKYVGAKLQRFQFHAKKNNEVFVTFQVVGFEGAIIDSMRDQWFLLKKSKDKPWKIHSIHADFDPQNQKSQGM